MTHMAATTAEATAPDVARIFLQEVVYLHRIPKRVVSDRDARFTSKFWSALMKLLGTKLAMSTAFHPQTDGQTERMNRTIEQVLCGYVNYQQDDWDEHLAMTEFAINDAVQASTKESPFKMNYGWNPRTPASSGYSNVPAALDWAQEIKTTMELVRERLQQEQKCQMHYANDNRRAEEFQIGDQVLLDA